MRLKIHQQMRITQALIDHPHAEELAQMDDILNQHPEILDWVHQDLLDVGVNADVGRDGMTAEQVLRALVIRMMNKFSYRELEFHLADSRCYRWFCRIGEFDKPPSRSTLQENISCVLAETMEAINRVILDQARREGIERGRKVRVDSTVTETNIHHPSDSSLLWDSIRTLVNLMTKLAEECGGIVDISFRNHKRRAKKRALAISNTRIKRKRIKLYKDLLKVTGYTVEYAEQNTNIVCNKLKSFSSKANVVCHLVIKLRQHIDLARRVIDQTYRRIILEEKVPASEKVFSIFEEHTDIIKKGQREVEYGHKIFLTIGQSSMTLDCVIKRGNPADEKLATPMVERQKETYGRAPRQAAFDGSFASKKNLEEIKYEIGVKDVAFQKKRGFAVGDMVKSTWVYKKLIRFRAGVEGVISFLKRCFGLKRCPWRGYESFKSYVWSSIVSANLLIMARHRLSRKLSDIG